jgi:hypothetical protein
MLLPGKALSYLRVGMDCADLAFVFSPIGNAPGLTSKGACDILRLGFVAEMSMRSIGLAALGVAASMACALPAFANGGDFFEELAASWSLTNADSGVPFFGFVKDSRGKNIPKASVMATTARARASWCRPTRWATTASRVSKSVDAQSNDEFAKLVQTGRQDRRLARRAPADRDELHPGAGHNKLTA